MTALTQQFEFKNVDWTISGAGDARDGDTTVTVDGVNGEVRMALMYWGELNFSGSSDNIVTVNGETVTGTFLGTSVDTCWGSDESLGYYADITSLVDGNGTFDIAGMGRGGQGASIVVFYDDGDVTNNRDVTIFAGNDSTDTSGAITTMNLGTLDYSEGDVNITMNVGDGQSFTDGDLTLNGNLLGTNQFPGGDGALWDVNTYDVTNLMSEGANNLQLVHESDNDCLQFISVIVDTQATTEKLFLDFENKIPIDYYVTNAGDASKPNKETTAKRAGDEPLGVFTDAQKTQIVNIVQGIFNRSGIAVEVVTEEPDEGNFHSVRFTSTDLVYDSNGDGRQNAQLLGEAFQGVDRYNKEKDNITAVLLDGNDNIELLAETVAHEAAHAYGARHVNPVEGNGEEVMDYDDHGDEAFVKTVVNVVEPPVDGNAGTGITHNPTYHLRHYVLGESDEQLRMEGITPGTWDRSFFNNILFSLGLSDLVSGLESLHLVLPDEYAIVSGEEEGDSIGRLVLLAEDLENLDQIEFYVPEGVEFQIVGSSSDDGELDVIFQFDPNSSDPYSMTASRDSEVSGQLVTGVGTGNEQVVASAALEVEAVEEVLGDEPDPALTLTVAKDTLLENTGDTTTLTVTREGDTTGDLLVVLSSDDTSEVTLPGTVTILDGESSAEVEVTALDDFFADGLQTAVITAQASGFVDGTLTIDVVDNETQTAGTDGDDSLVGTDNADQIFGLEGDDTIEGMGGDDTLGGGDGADLINGGDGNDSVTGRSGNDDLRLGLGDDMANGGEGDDIIRGNAGDDTIEGGVGNDTLRGQRDGDIIYGGEGEDNAKGGGGNDTVYGEAGDDFLKGGSRKDVVYGGEGNDKLAGNSFNDTLDGGEGDDKLNGGGDNDRIIGGDDDDRSKGGSGADTFVFDVNFGHDRILDFDIAEDMLEFTSTFAAGRSVDDLVDSADISARGLTLDFGFDSIYLRGVLTTDGLADAINIV